MNGFQLHKLKNVSISQTNKFRDTPSAWACDKLGKARFPASFPLIQGSAVESGAVSYTHLTLPTSDLV